LVDAHIPIDEFYKTFCPDQELDSHLPYETLAGLIINQLNRIPELGDSINSCGFEMTVIAMELYRIDKIKLIPLSQSADENSQ
jgi:putative hemolysin